MMRIIFLFYFSGVCSFFWFDKLNSDDPDTLQYDVVPTIVSCSCRVPPSQCFFEHNALNTSFASLLPARDLTDSNLLCWPENGHLLEMDNELLTSQI